MEGKERRAFPAQPARAGSQQSDAVQAGLLTRGSNRPPSQAPSAQWHYSTSAIAPLTVAGPYRILTGFPILRREFPRAGT
ncbi:MAG: hypothetical protein BWY06_00121 [Candidatus Latescibacteria bacterium ADurb.Bin168]|nr:MAG: hypothetical protein BWY06_00121 [Candidatus Latescibacteria bacterium ADurb.Bin168]